MIPDLTTNQAESCGHQPSLLEINVIIGYCCSTILSVTSQWQLMCDGASQS